MSRPYTEDEVRDQFLEYIHLLINYWKGADKPTCQDKMEGLAFSILGMLDGCSAGLPGFKVIPTPHPDDEGFHRLEGSNWYPDDVDIAGCLHERFYKE